MFFFFLFFLFLNSSLKLGISYTCCKSIWTSRKVLNDDLCWRVRRGDHIPIFDQAWIPNAINPKIFVPIINCNVRFVADIIDHSTKEWKKELIENTFDAVDAGRILRIPLSKFAHDDELVWCCDSSGEFSIKSAYNYYKTLFLILLPMKYIQMLELSIRKYGV